MGRGRFTPSAPHRFRSEIGLAAYTHDGPKNRVTEQHVLAIKADAQ